MARPNFIELPARDLAASRAFFEAVFGMAMTPFGPIYACTLTGDVDIGLQADPQEATLAPLPVIAVDDLEATLAAAVTKPIFGFPGGRRFHFRDPGGNELAAIAHPVACSCTGCLTRRAVLTRPDGELACSACDGPGLAA